MAPTVDVVVGTVGRAHGLRGEVTIRLQSDFAEERFTPGAVLPGQLQIEPEQLPPALAVSETCEVNSGMGTEIDTFCASDGPPLVAIATRLRLVPAITGSGESASVIDRSDCGVSVVVSVAELFAAFGSVMPPPTVAVAVLDSVPVAFAAIVALTV